MRKLGFLALGIIVSAALILAKDAGAGVPGFMKARMGTLTGAIYVDDAPLPEAIVSFFNEEGGPPPILGSARRVPDLVARTDSEGKFSVKLMPGHYFVGSLIRPRGAGPGPPRPGEKYFFARNEDGKLRTVEVATRQEREVGKIVAVAPESFVEFKSFITIRGKVQNEKETPLGGILITLKDDMNAPRPKYISAPTNEDGTYEVKVPPGKYYVLARESIRGGRPRPGSKVGIYGRKNPAGSAASINAGGGGNANFAPEGLQQAGVIGEAVSVEGVDGAVLEDVNITMFDIPDPEATRKKYEDEARAAEDQANEAAEENSGSDMGEE